MDLLALAPGDGRVDICGLQVLVSQLVLNFFLSSAGASLSGWIILINRRSRDLELFGDGSLRHFLFGGESFDFLS